MIELERINSTVLAFQRLASQFKESERLKAFIEIFTKQNDELQEALFQLFENRDLESAVGAQLDVIGRIVGQDRVLTDAAELAFFGLQDGSSPDTPEQQFEEGFGDLTNSSPGGLFRQEGQSTTGNIVLDDNTYRLFIRAKILKNYTNSTPESIIQIIRFIFGNYPVLIIERTAFAQIMIGRILNRNEKILLNYEDSRGRRLIPMTIAVGIEWGEFDGPNAFSFSEDLSPGKGFDDLSDPGNGGTFASLII